MEVKGTIKLIKAKQQISDKFAKREFVIETLNDKYPQTLILQTNQDKCQLLDSQAVGEVVNCHINLRGREWVNPQGEVKYFNTIECWKITNESANNFNPNNGNFENQVKEVEASAETGDLPF